VAEQPTLANDARFVTNSGRIENLPALRALLTDLMAGRSLSSWTTAFDVAGVPWGPINTMEEVFADAQVQHRCIVQTLDHPEFGALRTVRNPMLWNCVNELGAVGAPPSLPLPNTSVDPTVKHAASGLQD